MPVAERVQQRRANYDDALVRAQKMAIHIGAVNSVPGYEGFTADSYKTGLLDHSIAERPVFAPDPSEKLDKETAMLKVLAEAKKAGIPLTIALRRAGWNDKDILEVTNSPEYKAHLDGLQAVSQLGAAANPPTIQQEGVINGSQVPAV